MLKAVIFDFDGVIADTEELHFRATARILADSGIEFSKEDYYKNYLGYNDRDLFTKFIAMYPVLSGISIETLMGQKSVIYRDLIKDLNCVIDGVPGFIRTLAKNNIPIAICSGALRKEIEQILLKGDLLKFFKIIISADDVKVGKPDPQGFLLTLKRLAVDHPPMNIEAADCVVIEDSHWGIEAAKKAGMHTVGVTTSYSSDELGAEFVVDDLKHLTIKDIATLCR